MFKIFFEQVFWNIDVDIEFGNKGYCLGVKGGYFLVLLVDYDYEICIVMCNVLEEMGLVVEVYYYEVVIVGQNEIGVKFNILVVKVDEVQILKYCVYNVVDVYGKIVIFMLKLLYGDNGLGMYVYMLIFKDGKNIFVGEGYVGLFEIVLYFIGGIIKYGKVLNGFINFLINFYKCLVLGFEVLVMLVYLVCNCFVLICIFYVFSLKVCCIEVCFLDLVVNFYLVFVVLLMVGLDGIQNKIYFGDVVDKNLYDLLLEEVKEILQVCGSLKEVLEEFDKGCVFLIKGGVFIDEFIDVYIELKSEEEIKVCIFVYLLEYDLYYSV